MAWALLVMALSMGAQTLHICDCLAILPRATSSTLSMGAQTLHLCDGGPDKPRRGPVPSQCVRRRFISATPRCGPRSPRGSAASSQCLRRGLIPATSSMSMRRARSLTFLNACAGASFLRPVVATAATRLPAASQCLRRGFMPATAAIISPTSDALHLSMPAQGLRSCDVESANHHIQRLRTGYDSCDASPA